MPYQMTKPMQ